MHIHREPSFFRTKSTGAPQRETLGPIKPLSRRSAGYSFNFFNSAEAILYGEIEIGQVSGNTSMPKSISLSGGIPRRSSGKTSKNSFTTGTD